MQRTDVQIIWQGQTLPFDDVKYVEARPSFIIFDDKNMHRHTFSGVLYHIESYYDDEALPTDAIQ